LQSGLVAKRLVVHGGKMKAMRKRWTDERLDDLNHRVVDGFRRVEADLRAHRVEVKTDLTSLRGEMNDRFDKVDSRFEAIDSRFEKINDRFDALNRLIIRVGEGVIATIAIYSITSHL